MTVQAKAKLEDIHNMTQELDKNRLAVELLQARDEARVTTVPSQVDPNFNSDTAYQVGLAGHRELVNRGYRPVGRKIGFTNPATWREFRLAAPIWAHVYDRTLHFADQGRCTLSLQGTVAPRIEPEVVFKLHNPLPAGELTAEAVVPCIEWAAIGFEVVDSHYAGWKFTGPDAVADFGVHAALVVGAPWALTTRYTERLVEVVKSLRVTLSGGPGFVATGEGRNTLGSPLLALCRLATVLASQPWAPPLAAGEIITTGTLTALPNVKVGESYRVEVEGAPLSALELEFVG